jgi:hypothetical protein
MPEDLTPQLYDQDVPMLRPSMRSVSSVKTTAPELPGSTALRRLSGDERAKVFFPVCGACYAGVALRMLTNRRRSPRPADA